MRDTGSPVRSSIRSAARSTPPTSRAPHASVRFHGGDSARGATSRSTSASVTSSPSRPGRELVDLAGELVQVVADELGEAAARRGVGLRAVDGELLGDPLWIARVWTSQISTSPVAATAFAIGESFFSSPPTSASVVPGAGDLRYVGDRLRVRRLPRLDVLEDDEPCAGAEEPERVAGGDRVVARGLGRVVQLDRVGVEAPAQPRDRAVDLRAVAARDQVRRLQVVGHRLQG